MAENRKSKVESRLKQIIDSVNFQLSIFACLKFKEGEHSMNKIGMLLVFGIFLAVNLISAEEGGKVESKAQVKTKEVAAIQTKKGKIVFEFYPDDAPNTVDNFKKLANKGFYDGLKFHRVEPGFVIQGGDPKGNGTGGPGYNIKAEFNQQPHIEGTVAMARSQSPDSAGSQFYICLAPAPFLNGQYTVFGQVTEGIDVVHKIAVGDVMEKVTIETKK
jgi:peptidylprolyl isomerase/peptidyl-prolyl cis-trans isomerase B (cyclophilin B)